MSLFSNTQEVIAAKLAELKAYESAIALAAQKAPALLEQLKEVYEVLKPYEAESNQFMEAVLKAVNYQSVIAPASASAADAPIPPQNNPTLTLINKNAAIHESDFMGKVLYIGFDFKRSRNGGNSASIWSAFIEKNWSEAKNVRVQDSWEGCPIAQKYLIVVSGLNDEQIEEIAALNHSLLPEKALDEARFAPEETKENIASQPVNYFPKVEETEATPEVIITDKEKEIMENARQLVIASTNGSAIADTTDVPF